MALHDELAKVCPVCNAPFERMSSNHVGLAERLERRRANVVATLRESLPQMIVTLLACVFGGLLLLDLSSEITTHS